MILFLSVVSIFLPVTTLIIGFYAGFNIGKDKELPQIKTPSAIKEEREAEAEVVRKQDELEAYLDNIENYPDKQKDIPEEFV